MSIFENIESEIRTAMKARNADRLSALRMMKAALANRQIDLREKFTDDEATKVLQTVAKQRRESADAFRAAGREEQAAKEEAELAIVEEFLPAAATGAEIEAAVDEAIAEAQASSMKDVGRVMPLAIKKLAGKTVDGRAVNEAVRRKLG